MEPQIKETALTVFMKENQIESETEKREALERELKEKQDAEKAAAIEAEQAAELELSRGDKDKFFALIQDLNALKSKYSFKSKKYQTLQNAVNDLIGKILSYASGKI